MNGTMDAQNDAILKATLSKQGLTHVSVKEKPKPIYESKGRIKSKDVLFFTRQMATMLRAGMPALRALDLVGQSIEKPKKMRDMVFDIHDRIQNGATFAEALAAHPIQFDSLYTSLVAAGEDAGMLESTMDNIALNMEKGEATKKKVKKALTYPAIVMIFAVVVTAILLIKVVPVFADFFESNGGELPAVTQMVVSISDFMVNYGVYILVVLVALVAAFIYAKKRNKRLQEGANKFAFKIPIIGGILKCGANARFARTLATLFNAGVPMLRGLSSTAPATGSPIYEAAVYDIRENVQNGQQLSFAMKNTNLFPTIAVQMTAIGEESGNLGEMLGRVANFYEEELDWRIDNLTSMIEPFIMAFLAVVVGGLLIAMYMPIFNLGSMF
ncbi:type II secretion system F family protein [Suttonella sp. R2A3]|uniref:type II secretion system F family protein n=1 Tax=Suttonella sp. R2A3 TaxID=2908648 RepID=UPI001F2965E4|nr:type II secretion system F family protein [Suttonella sp. R2A3]UJF23710.1 type II secretion system F family protein [Suttonella sp. R2A3]